MENINLSESTLELMQNLGAFIANLENGEEVHYLYLPYFFKKDENGYKVIPKNELNEEVKKSAIVMELIEDSDSYWSERCRLAESYLTETLDDKKLEAYNKWINYITI